MNVKNVLQKWLREKGIEVRKAPRSQWPPLPVFNLAVEHVMSKKGKPLKFVQVGANDGMYGDPLRSYVLNSGWTGILCEPQRDVFELLKQNYQGHSDQLIFENIAISSAVDNIELFRAPNISARQGMARLSELTVTSSDPRTVSRQSGHPVDRLEKFSIPTMTLDALVQKHKFEQFDVLQIDVEGFDYDVLKTLSLDKYRPAVIQFEHGHLGVNQLSEAAVHLEKFGYILYFGGHSTDSVAMPANYFDNLCLNIK